MGKCNQCRFWSDKIAQARGNGVEALCLNGDSQYKGKYTAGWVSCESWKDAPLGAVDSGSDSDPRYGNPYNEAVAPL